MAIFVGEFDIFTIVIPTAPMPKIIKAISQCNNLLRLLQSERGVDAVFTVKFRLDAQVAHSSKGMAKRSA